MQVYNSGFRNRYNLFSFDEARANPAEWGRQVESAVGAHLANRSVLDNFFNLDIKPLFRKIR